MVDCDVVIIDAAIPAAIATTIERGQNRVSDAGWRSASRRSCMNTASPPLQRRASGGGFRAAPTAEHHFQRVEGMNLVDLAVDGVHLPMRLSRELRVVRDHQDRGASRALICSRSSQDLVRHASCRGFPWARRRESLRGSPAIARAIAARCCCPPESCEGIVLPAGGKPHALERRQDASFAFRRRHAPVVQRRFGVVVDIEIRDQIEPWKMEPIFSLRMRERWLSVSLLTSCPSNTVTPEVELLEEAGHVEERGLAGAGMPGDRDELARFHFQGRSWRRARVSTTSVRKTLPTLCILDHVSFPFSP